MHCLEKFSKMDTCCLIPEELSISLSSEWRSLLDMSVTIRTNQQIACGHVFYPDSGRFVLDRLETHRLLEKNDLRQQFGCADEIVNLSGREVRHCNWMRFVQSSSRDLANVVAMRIHGDVVLMVISKMAAYCEVRMLFTKLCYDSMPMFSVVVEDLTDDEVLYCPSKFPRTYLPRQLPSFSNRPITTPASLNSTDDLTDRSGQDSDGLTSQQDEQTGIRSPASEDQSTSEDEHIVGMADIKIENIEDHDNSNIDSEPESEHSPLPPSLSPSPPPSLSPSPPPSPPNKKVPLEFSISQLSQSYYNPSKLQLPYMRTQTMIRPTCLSSNVTQEMFHRLSRICADNPAGSMSRICGDNPAVPTHRNAVLLPGPKQQSLPATTTKVTDRAPRKLRERTMLPCDMCGKKFDRPSLLRRHVRTHTGEKPHVCDVCSKAFSTSSSLNTHRRIHSGEKPHQCPICGKRFTASSNLYYHRMTHNKEKPHKCTMCSKSFPTPGDLRSHMYIHSGSWPFKCHICNRGFSKQTNLNNHLLLHTGSKPHECLVCGKRFALLCNMKTHSKTHEVVGTMPLCRLCGVDYTTSDAGSQDTGSQDTGSTGVCVKCKSSLSPPQSTPHNSMFHTQTNHSRDSREDHVQRMTPRLPSGQDFSSFPGRPASGGLFHSRFSVSPSLGAFEHYPLIYHGSRPHMSAFEPIKSTQMDLNGKSVGLLRTIMPPCPTLRLTNMQRI